MFNFDYLLLSSLNTFDELSKNRYLSCKEKPLIRYIVKTETKSMNFLIKESEYNNNLYEPITLLNMPNYCKSQSLGEY